VTDQNFFEPNFFSYMTGDDPSQVTGQVLGSALRLRWSRQAISGVVAGITWVIAAAPLGNYARN
jgi:hypothetical protein